MDDQEIMAMANGIAANRVKAARQDLSSWNFGDGPRVLAALQRVEQILRKCSTLPTQQTSPGEGALGWNPDGTRRLTGRSQVDEFVVALQDAEDCWYLPIELMSGVDIDGDWSEKYVAGQLDLADGTRFERGGPARLIWTCTRLPTVPTREQGTW